MGALLGIFHRDRICTYGDCIPVKLGSQAMVSTQTMSTILDDLGFGGGTVLRNPHVINIYQYINTIHKKMAMLQ